MERSLALIAAEGWIPMAATMLDTAEQPVCRLYLFFFSWMLHGSTKVVVRAVSKDKDKVAMSLSKVEY